MLFDLWPIAIFIFDAVIWINLVHLIWNLICFSEKSQRFLVGSLSVSLRQKQLCVWELCTRWKGFNKVVSLLLVLPFLSLPRFTNVWMPLMRNQDHSRGAQWSRSCDNLLFRCWLAVEMGPGSDWNCICLSVGLCGSYSACGFHSNPIKEDKLSKSSEDNRWSKPLLCLSRHPVFLWGGGSLISYT